MLIQSKDTGKNIHNRASATAVTGKIFKLDCRWRHVGNVGTSTQMRETKHWENDLCDHCLDAKDDSVGNHAL